MNEAYRRLIESSPRVSTPTRRALLDRARSDDPGYIPHALSPAAFDVLRAVVDCIIPRDQSPIDLAARLDQQLAGGDGDGWRNARLPSDGLAYQAGLDSLELWARTEYGSGFVALPATDRDGLLRRSFDGRAPRLPSTMTSHVLLDPRQLRYWVEDLRADAVRLYMAHPDTFSRIGYSGIANGGDGEPKSGFVQVGINERESWEPVAHADPAS